jgi:hypothetical protein
MTLLPQLVRGPARARAPGCFAVGRGHASLLRDLDTWYSKPFRDIGRLLIDNLLNPRRPLPGFAPMLGQSILVHPPKANSGASTKSQFWCIHQKLYDDAAPPPPHPPFPPLRPTVASLPSEYLGLPPEPGSGGSFVCEGLLWGAGTRHDCQIVDAWQSMRYYTLPYYTPSLFLHGGCTVRLSYISPAAEARAAGRSGWTCRQTLRAPPPPSATAAGGA